MMKKTLALAALAVAASAQCTVNPNFKDAIDGVSADTTYTYTPTGTASEWGTTEGSVTGSTAYTGLPLGPVTLLAGFSSALDGNNGVDEATAVGGAINPTNFESHSFAAADGSCFNLVDGGVTVTDIDHDHDDDGFDDNYHDGVAVYFTLSDGSTVAGVPSPIGAYATSELTAAANAAGASTGLVTGPIGEDQYAANDVPFATQDICGTELCRYSQEAPLYSILFAAPQDAEVTGIEVRYFNAFPSAMPEAGNLDAAHIMAVALLNQPPTCTPVACNGISFDDVLCTSSESCNCQCQEFEVCTEPATCEGDILSGVQCTEPGSCECECDEYDFCGTSGLTCEGEFVTGVRCTDQDPCDCECNEFPICADPATCDGTITQGVRCPDATQCECECVVDNGCPVIEAECGDVTASGSTTTEKCICLEFGDGEGETGGGDF